MTRLFIVNLKQPNQSYEILEYKPDEKYALVRGKEGVYKDINFDLAVLKRYYRLTQDAPQWVEEQDAEFPGLRARLIAGERFDQACTPPAAYPTSADGWG